MNTRKQLKTGGDPRALADYVALRDEMMKLSHPARPDVNWAYAETLCLRLFEHNGVDLQTAAWFTLARMHIAGVRGMNEGLTLINALLAHQWSVLWPSATHGRMEIIAGLNQRLQTVFRTLMPDEGDELAALYQTEKQLAALGETLGRHELKQAGRTDLFLQQIRQAITQLENRPHSESYPSGVVLPPQALQPLAASAHTTPDRLVYVVQPEARVEVAMAIPDKKNRPVLPFLSGVCSALILVALIAWSWRYLHTPSPLLQQLQASVSPLAAPLTPEQRNQLNQTAPLSAGEAEALLQSTRERLQWLMSLPPDWQQQRGHSLLAQLQSLDQRNRAVDQIQKGWQQQLEANAMPEEALGSWYAGMSQLQAFAEKLNALDSKRGKYLTVSELKSEVFAITQTFNKNPPLEELLRQLGSTEGAALQSLAQQVQSKMKLNQVLNRYYLLVDAENKNGEAEPQ